MLAFWRWPIAATAVAVLAVGCGDDSSDSTRGDGSVALVEVAALDFPTGMAARPGTDDLFVTEKAGQVRRLTNDGDELALDDEVVLDLVDEVGEERTEGLGGETGLIGLTFSPDGSRLYLSLTESLGRGGPWLRKLVEYTMDGDEVDEESRRVLLEYEKEWSQHNGGDLHFGPDGYLYLGLGDGGVNDEFVDDPLDTGQDPTVLLGSILRIDPMNPTGDASYAIPPDNPFVDGLEGAPEVWLYGVRNPWQFSFDRETGDLWIADVGTTFREEINVLPVDDDGTAGRGANLGWSAMEGTAARFGADEPAGHVAPVHELTHREGACGVIGGYVYRGDAIPVLDGTYLFADLCLPDVLTLERSGEAEVEADVLVEAPGTIIAFAEDTDGEIYALTMEGVFKLVQDG